ncbi:MAG: regulatory protein GemA [Holophagales bacterium]|nr:regulatory protein GemA [Holophagales bacterium]
MVWSARSIWCAARTRCRRWTCDSTGWVTAWSSGSGSAVTASSTNTGTRRIRFPRSGSCPTRWRSGESVSKVDGPGAAGAARDQQGVPVRGLFHSQPNPCSERPISCGYAGAFAPGSPDRTPGQLLVLARTEAVGSLVPVAGRKRPRAQPSAGRHLLREARRKVRREITKGQIRAIHTALSALGIDDETYRALLRDEWDATSCKDLSRSEASELLDHLIGPMKKAKPRPVRMLTRSSAAGKKERPPRPLPPGVARMASPAQRRLIDELRSEIEWRAGDAGYEVWLRRNMGLERVLTSSDAARVIEGLKAMKRRKAG